MIPELNKYIDEFWTKKITQENFIQAVILLWNPMERREGKLLRTDKKPENNVSRIRWAYSNCRGICSNQQKFIHYFKQLKLKSFNSFYQLNNSKLSIHEKYFPHEILKDLSTQYYIFDMSQLQNELIVLYWNNIFENCTTPYEMFTFFH